MRSDAEEPELLFSAFEYDRGGPCSSVSLAGRAEIANCSVASCGRHRRVPRRRQLIHLPAAIDMVPGIVGTAGAVAVPSC